MHALFLTVLSTVSLPWPQEVTLPHKPSKTEGDSAVVLGQTSAGHDVGLLYYRPEVLDPTEIIDTITPVHGRWTEYVDPSTGTRHDHSA